MTEGKNKKIKMGAFFDLFKPAPAPEPNHQRHPPNDQGHPPNQEDVDVNEVQPLPADPEPVANVVLPRVEHKPPKLPDSGYKYLTDPKGVSSLAPISQLISNPDVKTFVDNIQKQFLEALSFRRNVDDNSRQLRELVGRDDNAELPACLTIWAERAFRGWVARQDDIQIEYADVRGNRMISSITILTDVDEDTKHISECVQRIITSCHACIEHADLAIQSINGKHKALGELHCRTSAVMATMRCAENLCVELEGFVSQVSSLLKNFDAAMSFFTEKAEKHVTGILYVLPDRPM